MMVTNGSMRFQHFSSLLQSSSLSYRCLHCHKKRISLEIELVSGVTGESYGGLEMSESQFPVVPTVTVTATATDYYCTDPELAELMFCFLANSHPIFPIVNCLPRTVLENISVFRT